MQEEKKLRQWIVTLVDFELECFNRFIKMLNKHMAKITHYFIRRNDSDLAEGFNNKVKIFQRLVLDTTGLLRFAPGVMSFK